MTIHRQAPAGITKTADQTSLGYYHRDYEGRYRRGRARLRVMIRSARRSSRACFELSGPAAHRTPKLSGIGALSKTRPISRPVARLHSLVHVPHARLRVLNPGQPGQSRPDLPSGCRGRRFSASLGLRPVAQHPPRRRRWYYMRHEEQRRLRARPRARFSATVRQGIASAARRGSTRLADRSLWWQCR